MKTIELTAPHEHEGRERQSGDVLVLTEADANWLIGAGKAKAAVSTPSNTAKASSAPKAIESTQDKEQQA